MWGYYGDYGWWWWGFGALHMLLYWGVLILVIALLVRWLFTDSPRREGSSVKTALNILKERYARGEIGKEEVRAEEEGSWGLRQRRKRH